MQNGSVMVERNTFEQFYISIEFHPLKLISDNLVNFPINPTDFLPYLPFHSCNMGNSDNFLILKFIWKKLQICWEQDLFLMFILSVTGIQGISWHSMDPFSTPDSLHMFCIWICLFFQLSSHCNKQEYGRCCSSNNKLCNITRTAKPAKHAWTGIEFQFI